MTVTSIFASTIGGGIGWRNKLPWTMREDLRNFEHFTCNVNDKENTKAENGILMGRRTWESLPKKPLPKRSNCVVSSAVEISRAPLVVQSIHEGIKRLQEAGCSTVYLTGGKGIYDAAHEQGLSDYIVWTRVCGPDIKCDVSVDVKRINPRYVPLGLCKTQRSGRYTFDVAFYARNDLDRSPAHDLYERRVLQYLERLTAGKILDQRNTSFSRPVGERAGSSIAHRGHEEFQYLDIMRDIIETGLHLDDRTGVGTVSKFGAVMRFDLSETFPLLTTKRVYWKGVVEELLWFLRGHTDGKELAAADVHIWDGNGSKEFLESRGLGHRREGDLGPVYGFQWRHFGAPYTTCDADYSGSGIDQVQQLIEGLRKDPTSRRHIISAWNPAALSEMALPPCHVLSQFVVDPKSGELSCCLYQRSGDWGLGIPFNIASYSLLTLIIAKLTGLKAKEFVHFVANAHVYENHREPLIEQLKRMPRPFPRVVVADGIESVDKIQSSDIQLIGYEPFPSIKMEMAV